jgi:thiol-disulfide isomerase/thioredoxin
VLWPRRDVPAVRLFRLDGTTVELSALKGRPILLNFWATWCVPCRTELPVLDRLHEQNGAGGLHVLAVSEDQAGRSAVVRFVEALGIRHLPIFRDPNGYVASRHRDDGRSAPFALYGMPITYLISASGKVVGYISGAADWNNEAARNLSITCAGHDSCKAAAPRSAPAPGPIRPPGRRPISLQHLILDYMVQNHPFGFRGAIA